MEKITVSLPAKSLKFIEQYRKEHSLKSHSEVVEIALAMLQESEREDDLGEAPQQDELDDLDKPQYERSDTE
ncbi:MAG: CopG family transcriptional regulator [Betaproteobacteria bacterium]|nr:CopG family transcriptional regulator [Betaproteobacteria bacterium]